MHGLHASSHMTLHLPFFEVVRANMAVDYEDGEDT